MNSLQEVAEKLGEVFEGYFSTLHELREAVESKLSNAEQLDELVLDFVGPRPMARRAPSLVLVSSAAPAAPPGSRSISRGGLAHWKTIRCLAPPRS